MKRQILGIVVLLVTFASGLLSSSLVQSQPVERKVPLPLAEMRPPIPLVTAAPTPAPIPTPVPTPETEIILDYDAERFVPYGVYFVLGKIPGDFKELDSIELIVSGAVEDPGVIMLNTRPGVDGDYNFYQATFGLVSERRVFFVTRKNQETGVSYRFDGEFLRRDISAVAGKNVAVIRGTLTRSRNGRTTAERVVNLRVEHLGC